MDLVSANAAATQEPSASAATVEPSAGKQAQETDRARYRVANLSGFAVDPDRFFEAEYDTVIRGMVDAIIETEAPLRTDILAQRIARVHGWLRTGARIRERIERHLRHLERT